MSAANGSSSKEAAAGAANIQPSDVGWQFVPQYYNFVNKQPHRLHCFYNKESTFVHGEEGEDTPAAYGQQEIHERITKIGYDQCKVYINSIDSQSSANGGVIIQVLGEMSNASGPYRKFAQTFFLAQQPNGYFVLNDIFRYLKEDSEDDEEHDIEDAAAVTAAPDQQADQAHAQTVPTAPVAIEQEEEVVAEAEAEPEAAAPAEAEPVAAEPETPAAEEKEEEAPEPTPAPKAEQAKPAASPAPPAEKAPTANGSEAGASGANTPAPAAAAAAAAAPAAPAAPAKPKSWASLAAGGKAWSTTVAASTPAAPVAAAPAPKKAEAPSAAAPPAPAAAAAASTPAPAAGASASPSGRHPYYDNAMKVQTPHCFVKLPNWSAADQATTETMDENALKNIASRFGEVAKVEIVKGKACAFVEFAKVDGARKAIVASLATHQGGEGGVASDYGKLNFETRKEKDERGPKGRRGPEGAGRGGRGGGARTGGEGERGQNAGRGRGRGRGGANAGGDRQPK